MKNRKVNTVSVWSVNSLTTLLANTPKMHHFDVTEQGEDTSYVFYTSENIEGFNVYRTYEYTYMPTELEEYHMVRESRTRLNRGEE